MLSKLTALQGYSDYLLSKGIPWIFTIVFSSLKMLIHVISILSSFGIDTIFF